MKFFICVYIYTYTHTGNKCIYTYIKTYKYILKQIKIKFKITDNLSGEP